MVNMKYVENVCLTITIFTLEVIEELYNLALKNV